MLSALGGLAAGALHVVGGPDHLTAVAPLAVHDRGRAFRVGAFWGIGHGVGVLSLGLLGQLLKEAVDIHLISGWSEFLVGFLLLGMGAWALRVAWSMTDMLAPDHSHPHHPASTNTAVLIGVLHGAAGGGHLFGVLPSLALPLPQAVAYLVCYLLAAVVSMGAFGVCLGVAAERGGAGLIRGMMFASAAAAIGVGIWWIVSAFPHA